MKLSQSTLAALAAIPAVQLALAAPCAAPGNEPTPWSTPSPAPSPKGVQSYSNYGNYEGIQVESYKHYKRDDEDPYYDMTEETYHSSPSLEPEDQYYDDLSFDYSPEEPTPEPEDEYHDYFDQDEYTAPDPYYNDNEPYDIGYEDGSESYGPGESAESY